MSLGKFKKALLDFEFVAKRRPNDRDAAMKYTECNKLVRKAAFEKAISCDIPEKTLAELHSDLESIEIEEGNLKFHHYIREYLIKSNLKKYTDYDGPKLDDGNVTLEFMEELLEYYKNQKKLHRKYAYKVRKSLYLLQHSKFCLIY